jgi:hypothetical protein
MRAIFTSSGAPEVTCSRSPGPRLVGDIRRRRIILGLALQNTRSALEIDPIAGPIGSAETEYDTGKYVAQRGNGYATYSHRATPRLYTTRPCWPMAIRSAYGGSAGLSLVSWVSQPFRRQISKLSTLVKATQAASGRTATSCQRASLPTRRLRQPTSLSSRAATTIFSAHRSAIATRFDAVEIGPNASSANRFDFVSKSGAALRR